MTTASGIGKHLDHASSMATAYNVRKEALELFRVQPAHPYMVGPDPIGDSSCVWVDI